MTVIAEAPVAEAPVVESEAPPAAEPVAPASPEGDQPAPEPGNEEKEPSLLDVASDPELLRKAIEAGVKPEEIHRAIREQAQPDTAEEIRREADRIRTQEREAEEAIRTREEAFTAHDQTGRRNARWLLDQAAMVDSDPDTAVAALFDKITDAEGRQRTKFSAALDSVYAGAIASTTLGMERAINALLEGEHKEALDALPADKKAELKKARYEFATKGSPEALLRIAFDAVATHKAAEAEVKGEKKGEENAEATKASLELMKKLRDGGVFVTPRVSGGVPQKTGPLTLEEAQTLPIDELIQRTKAQ